MGDRELSEPPLGPRLDLGEGGLDVGQFDLPGVTGESDPERTFKDALGNILAK